MKTLYSIAFAHREGGESVVDYVAGAEAGGWYRHEFDADGGYLSVGPVSLSALAPLAAEGPAPLARELRAIADAMDAALDRLRGPGTEHLRRDRREVLDRLDWVSALARGELESQP